MGYKLHYEAWAPDKVEAEVRCLAAGLCPKHCCVIRLLHRLLQRTRLVVCSVAPPPLRSHPAMRD